MSFIQKTFKGLTPSYYWRHFIFAAIINGGMFLVSTLEASNTPIGFLLFLLINPFLAPYAYFAWDAVEGFIWGEGTIIALTSTRRLIRIIVCICLAFFVAPIGLIILYFINNKAEKEARSQDKP